MNSITTMDSQVDSLTHRLLDAIAITTKQYKKCCIEQTGWAGWNIVDDALVILTRSGFRSLTYSNAIEALVMLQVGLPPITITTGNNGNKGKFEPPFTQIAATMNYIISMKK